LDEQKVIDVLKRLEKGESQSSIARSYGVNRVRICEIAKDKAWKHVKVSTENEIRA
jgi:transcriptional regulator